MKTIVDSQGYEGINNRGAKVCSNYDSAPCGRNVALCPVGFDGSRP